MLHVPYRSFEGKPGALSLFRRAPTFTVEWMDGEQVAVAVFSSLPVQIDLAVQLVGESIGLAGAWASVNARPMTTLFGFWHRLVCYRESLEAADPARYCREQSARFNAMASLSAVRSAGPCQFMSLSDAHATGATANRQFEVAARLAEIDWCPRLNLHLPGAAPKKPAAASNGGAAT